MPRRSGIDGPPRSYATGGNWPNGEIDGPLAARYAQAIALSVVNAMGNLSQRELARRADVRNTTVRDLLLGETWTDLVTLAKLEAALGVSLWPKSPLS